MPSSGLAHAFHAIRIGKKFRDLMGQLVGTVTRDNQAGFRHSHGLRGAARISGDHRAAAGLSFQQDHAETFDVSADGAIGQDENVTLLVALDQPLVFDLTEKLDVFLQSLARDQSPQRLEFLTITGDGVERVGYTTTNLNHGTDQLIVALAKLKPANGQDDWSITPAEAVADRPFAGCGREPGCIDSRV